MVDYCQNSAASVLEIAMHNVSQSSACMGFLSRFAIAQSSAIHPSNKLDSARLWVY